jgi:hypothetical protein
MSNLQKEVILFYLRAAYIKNLSPEYEFGANYGDMLR